MHSPDSKHPGLRRGHCVRARRGAGPCQEAVCYKDDKKIIAWFTPAIPISSGPLDYGNLPGMILEVDIAEGTRLITATSIDKEPIEVSNMVKPKKGKKVSQEEFDKIMEEKMKEAGIEGGGSGFQPGQCDKGLGGRARGVLAT